MNKYTKKAGLALIFAGVLLFVIKQSFAPTANNIMLSIAFLLVVAGIAMHVITMKNDSKY
ncbi:MAG: hypothetical protein J6B91_06860 [Prevotella sp.]|nr:hypothetical protein [Prevotella sp.]